MDPVFSCAAVDIGTHASSTNDAQNVLSYRKEIFGSEKAIEMVDENDYDIFDIEYDNDEIYDDIIYLL